MDFLRRRSLTELGIVATAIIAIAFSVGWWQQRSPGNGDDRKLVAVAAATLTAQASDDTTEPPVSSRTATHTSGVAATAQAANCPVTPPSPTPPDGWIENVDGNPVWYEAKGVGVWISPVSITEFDPTLDTLSATWFTGSSRVTVWPPILEDPLLITGQTAANQGGTIEFEIHDDDPRFVMNSTITFPEPGCWNLEVTVGEESDTLVIFALDQNERPDFAAAAQARTALQTSLFQVPASCSVTEPFLADRQLDSDAALYWFDGEALTASVPPPGVFWANQQMTMTWYSPDSDDLAIRGIHRDSPGTTLLTSTSRHIGESGQRWESEIEFPRPGCWEISGTSDTASLSVTVYVFPFECNHQPGDAPPENCRPPTQ